MAVGQPLRDARRQHRGVLAAAVHRDRQRRPRPAAGRRGLQVERPVGGCLQRRFVQPGAGQDRTDGGQVRRLAGVHADASARSEPCGSSPASTTPTACVACRPRVAGVAVSTSPSASRTAPMQATGPRGTRQSRPRRTRCDDLEAGRRVGDQGAACPPRQGSSTDAAPSRVTAGRSSGQRVDDTLHLPANVRHLGLVRAHATRASDGTSSERPDTSR